MFGFIFGYMVVGIVACSAVVIIHLISAESQGYEALDYWEEAFPIIERKITVGELIWSMVIWPVRIWQSTAFVQVFYDSYDYKKYGPRTRKGWL